ncbi:MAG: hypothetical protein EWV84_13200 [Microcystis sp. M_QC_C_20170808_M3Col]|nr:MAG: hypothetical protein EWV84_13200 [Microcystis sp. M_QC_C_20170808_M3Col]
MNQLSVISYQLSDVSFQFTDYRLQQKTPQHPNPSLITDYCLLVTEKTPSAPFLLCPFYTYARNFYSAISSDQSSRNCTRNCSTFTRLCQY